MKPKVKPGIASLVVFTAVTVIIFWAAMEIEAPKEFYAFLSIAYLLLIWFSSWRRHRALSRQIEEASAAVEVDRDELRQRIERLEGKLAGPGAAESQTKAVVPPLQPAATTVAVAATTQSRLSAFTKPTISSPPSPPSPPPPPRTGQAATNLTFGQPFGARPADPNIFQRLLKLEELLGTNWLAKVGSLLVVLGIAFLLNLALRSLGAMGKVLLGWVVGAILLGAGIFFERSERYRIIARAGAAAGWAIAFFTAFAMNHVAAARVISSEIADLALMFAVAAAMVLHTLRYRSQLATGLAFLFAFAGLFATVFPSRGIAAPSVSSLTAAVVLAWGVAWVAARRQWFVLEICAIVATYLNHFVWLIHIIQPMGNHHHDFSEFLSSAAILVSYWAVYRFSYLTGRREGHEPISALAALLNTGLLLAVLKYQAVHPEYAFWALLALGALELGLGQVPQARRRSTPHIVLTVIGACLLFTAIPFRIGLDAKGVALLWLAMAQAFFLVGVLINERVFLRVGLFAFVPLSVELIAIEGASVLGARMDGSDVKGEFASAALCLLSALVLFANVHWASRRWATEFRDSVEQLATRDLSYFAAALAFLAGWLAFPHLGAAVAWMAIACATAWLGDKFEIQPLQTQSILLAGFAFLRALVVNLPAASAPPYHVLGRAWPARFVTTAAAVVLCYLAAYGHRRTAASWLRWLRPSLAWAASTMFTLLLWYELSSIGVALGWGAFALIMLETGIRRGSPNLRLQAYVAGASAFLRLLFVNLNAASGGERLNPQFYSIVPLVVLFFYIYQRLDEQATHLSPRERTTAVPLFAWLGTTTIVLLLRFEVRLDWVATAWAALVVALMALAWRTGKRIFVHQALLLSLGVLFRGVLHNLYERTYFAPPSVFVSNLSTISAAGFLFFALFFAFRLRRPPPAEEKNWMVHLASIVDAQPEQLLFFAALLLFTAFLGVELRSGLVTLAWTLEAVAVFSGALWIGERSYRLAAMGLLLLVIGKIFIFDFRHMSFLDRAITFTAVGVLIIGVSILYTRYREKVSQFL